MKRNHALSKVKGLTELNRIVFSIRYAIVEEIGRRQNELSVFASHNANFVHLLIV